MRLELSWSVKDSRWIMCRFCRKVTCKWAFRAPRKPTKLIKSQRCWTILCCHGKPAIHGVGRSNAHPCTPGNATIMDLPSRFFHHRKHGCPPRKMQCLDRSRQISDNILPKASHSQGNCWKLEILLQIVCNVLAVDPKCWLFTRNCSVWFCLFPMMCQEFWGCYSWGTCSWWRSSNPEPQANFDDDSRHCIKPMCHLIERQGRRLLSQLESSTWLHSWGTSAPSVALCPLVSYHSSCARPTLQQPSLSRPWIWNHWSNMVWISETTGP